ncbi:MAG: winged helix-turn-helix transcriptional regulator [Hyphomicrobiales bacterium]|nr:winged helix-turn-helix transcriptional regulator [Hyphomicrobiales bacterium]
MNRTDTLESLAPGLLDQCLVTKARRAARTITRRYSRLLEPHGLKSTQATLLHALLDATDNSISALADRLGIERSALNRNLKILEKTGLIACPVHGRGRARAYSLTRRGQEKMAVLLPLWHEAQHAVKTEIGAKDWNDLQRTLNTVARLS